MNFSSALSRCFKAIVRYCASFNDGRSTCVAIFCSFELAYYLYMFLELVAMFLCKVRRNVAAFCLLAASEVSSSALADGRARRL